MNQCQEVCHKTNTGSRPPWSSGSSQVLSTHRRLTENPQLHVFESSNTHAHFDCRRKSSKRMCSDEIDVYSSYPSELFGVIFLSENQNEFVYSGAKNGRALWVIILRMTTSNAVLSSEFGMISEWEARWRRPESSAAANRRHSNVVPRDLDGRS